MEIQNLQHKELSIKTLVTIPAQIWCFYGENNSGIDQMLELLAGTLSNFSAETLQLPKQPGILSFQAQQEIYEEEMRNDDSDFLDKIDPGTLVSEFLPNVSSHLPLLSSFAMDNCLQLGYRQLSSGQTRKLLFLQKIIDGASSLILQNPYDGLDERSCRELDLALQQLPKQNIELILLVNSVSDIPAWCTHLARIRAGRLEKAGPKEQILPLVHDLQSTGSIAAAPLIGKSVPRTFPDAGVAQELIFLQDGFAGYGDRKLFTGLELVVRTGDHTLITGPNGCGKSTLLDIITGDNPKCYANKLRIFGKPRGSGESVWDIKKNMGIVSPALHREHRIPGSALHVILSGLHDSIGLYAKVSSTEIKTATRWLSWLSLAEKSNVPFKRLSFAEQRLVLIGRALIKRPRLLILDEPSQGLDDANREKLLELLKEITVQQLSTILFVSHRRDEHRPFFKQQIKLDSYGS